MATLVLTAVGSVFGPVGAALGGLVGNAIDRSVLAPKGRQGPRLTELKLQTSSYGTPIPRLFGTMRVAGTVIWATDLRESRTKSGGGKGRPATTSYSYSASFAVLLSARAIAGIGRVWADGKLLRGAAGDLKVGTGFRVHPGGEDQAPDPLIAAAEGVGATPALRGQAYVVFEDMQLADYGNRIPSLTFEVFADPGGTAPGTIAAALGVPAEAPGRALTGFSAHGDSVRGVLETLALVEGAWFASSDGTLQMRAGPGAAVELSDAGMGGARRARTVAPGAARRIALSHYDPARDFQAGLQRAGRAGAAVREEAVELPAALDAGAAKAVAAAMVARAALRRERRTLRPGLAGLSVAPGDRARIAGEPGQWRVARWSLEGMAVTLELERIAGAPIEATAGATPGRAVTAPDLVHGPTLLHAFELPPLDDAIPSAPRLTVAAAGGAGWRQAALLLSTDGGARWTEAGAARVPATIGTVMVPPRAAGAGLRDDAGWCEVELAHDGMTLDDADETALDGGLNLALVGDELLQFGRAAPVGARRWRLSRLLRGRRGTEAAAGTQSAGDRMVLLQADALTHLELPLAALGTEMRVLASGVGDLAGPAAAAVMLDGASVAPPAPVALHWRRTANGDAEVGWTRRSRGGWRWRDGADAPLVEEVERYRVTVDGVEHVVAAPAFTVPVGQRGAAVTVAVRQLGTLAESRAVTLVIPADQGE